MPVLTWYVFLMGLYSPLPTSKTSTMLCTYTVVLRFLKPAGIRFQVSMGLRVPCSWYSPYAIDPQLHSNSPAQARNCADIANIRLPSPSEHVTQMSPEQAYNFAEPWSKIGEVFWLIHACGRLAGLSHP